MKSFWILALMAVFSLAALAADASGTWKASMEGPNGTMESTFAFKVDGDKLTGTVTMGQMGEAPTSEGKVDGDNVSFALRNGGFAHLPHGHRPGEFVAVHLEREGALHRAVGPFHRRLPGARSIGSQSRQRKYRHQSQNPKRLHRLRSSASQCPISRAAAH